jgi:hypothetical protein
MVGPRVRKLATIVRRLLALSIVLSALVAVRASSPAFACSCAGPADVVARQDKVDAAFVGTVTDAPAAGFHRVNDELVTLTFAVEGVYRGELPATLTVKSDNWGSMCDVIDTSVGTRLDVVLRRKDGSWLAEMCSSFPAESLAELGPLRLPAADAAASDQSVREWAWLWGGAVLLVVGASAALAIRKRRA